MTQFSAAPPPKDLLEAARAARLRYVHDDRPGITRERQGNTFVYRHPDGTFVTDPADIERIKALGIPPAYTHVWICPNKNGHLQATGRDAKGRKQYRYHSRWRETRDETKYGRMLAFGAALPQIRERIAADLSRHGFPREKTLATIVRLLEETHIRIGNEEYAKTNQSFGLTTLHNEHVEVEGGTVHFHFRGKSGKHHAIDLRDPRLARLIKHYQDLPGQELFGYIDENGQPHTIDSSDVNAYLHEITGQEFTAKDFRTWAGTLLAARELAACEPCVTPRAARKAVTAVIKTVAAHLGNTPAVCRKCYVHPAILAAYIEGVLSSAWTPTDGEEAALMALLDARTSFQG